LADGSIPLDPLTAEPVAEAVGLIRAPPTRTQTTTNSNERSDSPSGGNDLVGLVDALAMVSGSSPHNNQGNQVNQVNSKVSIGSMRPEFTRQSIGRALGQVTPPMDVDPKDSISSCDLEK
jgi:hypothetical protein